MKTKASARSLHRKRHGGLLACMNEARALSPAQKQVQFGEGEERDT